MKKYKKGEVKTSPSSIIGKYKLEVVFSTQRVFPHIAGSTVEVAEVNITSQSANSNFFIYVVFSAGTQTVTPAPFMAMAFMRSSVSQSVASNTGSTDQSNFLLAA